MKKWSWGGSAALMISTALAQAETQSIRLSDENPLLKRETLIYANVGLVLIAAGQVGYSMYRRKNKYRLAGPAPGPAPAPGTTTPARAPAQSPPAQAPARAQSPRAIKCANCGAGLRLAAPAGAKYRCPTCQTVQVAP